MSKILYINSSPRGNDSFAVRAAEHFLEHYTAKNPSLITKRDIAIDPLPHMDASYIEDLFTPVELLTTEKMAKYDKSNELIDELLSHDVLLLTVPMYNYSIPSTLKAWIDHIVRVGRTLKFDPATGPEGLVKAKLILVLSTGAVFSSGPFQSMDFQEPYLRSLFKFIGITDVSVIRVEGSGMDTESAKKALEDGYRDAEALAQTLAA